MFGKKPKVENTKINLPENTPINEEVPQIPAQEEVQQSVQNQEEQPTEQKEFVSIVSAELLPEGLFRYIMVSNREFKLGLQEE